jgi:hypothetical protein
MISIAYDPITGTGKLTVQAVVKAGFDCDVRISMASAPGLVSSLALALISADADADVLAYTEAFEAENATTWVALLDANDTRLVEFMAGKSSVTVAIEFVSVIDGKRRAAPNLAATVQASAITGPESTEGGPVYLTDMQTAAAIAAAVAEAVASLTAPNGSVLKHGLTDIDEGVSTMTVTFQTGFPSESLEPTVTCNVYDDAGGIGDNISVVKIKDVTSLSFTVNFNGPVPAGYKLSWMARLSV